MQQIRQFLAQRSAMLGIILLMTIAISSALAAVLPGNETPSSPTTVREASSFASSVPSRASVPPASVASVRRTNVASLADDLPPTWIGDRQRAPSQQLRNAAPPREQQLPRTVDTDTFDSLTRSASLGAPKDGQVLMFVGGRVQWQDPGFLRPMAPSLPYLSEPGSGRKPSSGGGSASRTSGGGGGGGSQTVIVNSGGSSGGMSQSDADARYVNVPGDTMTGPLRIEYDGLGLLVTGGISGALVHAEQSLSSSGALVWEEAASGATLYVATSISGAGLLDCDGGSSKLLWDSTTGRFSCGTDQTVGTGLDLFTGDERYVNTSGDTMTGALHIRVLGGDGNTIGLRIANTASGRHLHAEQTLSASGTLAVEGLAMLSGDVTIGDAMSDTLTVTARLGSDFLPALDGAYDLGSPSARFGSGYFATGVKVGNSIYILTDSIEGTHGINLVGRGATNLTFTTNGSERMRIGSDGRIGIGITDASTALEVLGTASGTDLFATKSITGTHLYIASTFGGAGLGSCNGSTQKLLYSAVTKQFSCGTDQNTTAWSSTGSLQTAFDARYVNQSGDTMTGALTINVTGGGINTIGLKVINTLSGAHLHAESLLTSSGTLALDGTATFNAAAPLKLTSVGFYNCTALETDADGDIVCGSDADTNTTYTAGQGLTLNGTVFRLSDSFSGTSLVIRGTISGTSLIVSANASISGALLTQGNITTRGTLSGARLFVATTASISGSLAIENSLTGATFYGFGLTNCVNSSTSKLLYNASTGKFSCGTDQTGGTGSAWSSTGSLQTAFDARFVNQSGDTMTGALTINLTSGYLGLRILQTASGNFLHAEKGLSSSGTLVVTGNTLLKSHLDVTGTISGSALEVLGTASGTNLYATKSITGTHLYIASTFGGAGLGSCNGSTQKLLYNASTKQFSCDTDLNSSWSSTGSLQTAFDSRYVNTSGDTMTGNLLIKATLSGRTLIVSENASISGALVSAGNITTRGTLSGARLFVATTASISGSLAIENSLTGATFYGFGLTNCANSSTSKLLYNASTGKFSCGTDQTGGAGSAWSTTGSLQTAFDARYVNQSGDTMTGVLRIGVRGALGGSGALWLSTAGGPHIMFGSGGSRYDVSLRRSDVGILMLSGSLVPRTTNRFDLGSSALRFRDLYLSGSSLHIGSSTLEGRIGFRDSGTEGMQLFANGTSSTPTVFLSSGGLVGVNTATPTQLLHARTSGQDAAILLSVDAIIGGAASSGPRSAATFAHDSAVGSFAWTNASNAASSDNIYAEVSGGISYLLKATDFGFSIPNGSTINGIVAEVEKHSAMGMVTDNAVRLVKGGSVTGDNKASLSSWPSSDTNSYVSYGGASDLWGTTWSVSDINASNFGVAISAKDTDFDGGYIDHIRITVHYTTPNSGGLDWTIGSDYSDGSKLKIAQSSVLGSNDLFVLTATGSLGIGTLSPKAKLDIVGTISGKTLVISGNASVSGALLAQGNITTRGTLSGARLFVATTASISGSLAIENSLTGATFYGFGLTNCVNSSTSKLLYNASTGKFSCGTDQTGGAGSAWSSTGSLQTAFDARFVNQSGDTMTGALTINVTGGNASSLGLKVMNTLSGAHLHAEKSLTSSGTLSIEGTTYLQSSTPLKITDAGFYNCTALETDADGDIVCGSDADTNTTYTAGQGLTLNGTVFRLSDSFSGTSLVIRGTISGTSLIVSGNASISGALLTQGDITTRGTLSGARLFVATTASISGSLAIENSLTGATFYGFGLTNCVNSSTSKLLYNASTGKFSCGTDQTSSTWSNTGSLQTAFDARFVNQSGDTMTGALVIQTSTSRTKALSLVGSGSYTIMSASGGSIIHTARGNNTIVGSLNDATNLQGISRSVIAGRYAYVTNYFDDSLRIIDISNPASPVIVGGVKDGTNLDGPRALAVIGRYAYVMTIGDQSLRIIDISNPASPVIVGGLKNTTHFVSIQNIVVSGRYAYMTSVQNDSLIIIDVSNPFAPTLVSVTTNASTLNGAYDVKVVGRYAYVGNKDDNSLRILDVSNPKAPVIVGGIKDNTNLFGVMSVVVDKGYAYVAASQDNSLQVIDVSNPASPSIVGSVRSTSLLSSVEYITIAGRYLYAVAGNHSMTVIDIGIPTSPVIVGGVQHATYLYSPSSISVRGRFAYVTSDVMAGENRLTVIDLSGIDTPTASIGALMVGGLQVMGDTRFDQNVAIDRSLNIGDGLRVMGQTSMRAFSGSALTLSTMDTTGLPALTVSGSVAIGTGSSKNAALNVLGTISGSRLVISGKGSFSGALVVSASTGRTLTIDSGMTEATANIFEIYSDYSTTNNKILRVQGNGAVYADSAYNSTGADYAEWFLDSGASDHPLKPGELVCIDVLQNNAVRRCERSGDTNLMGIVSTNPAFIGNTFTGAGGIMPPGYVLVGLIGQVPAKVSLENGDIHPGDALTSSKVPGVARKASAGESTVGVALEGFDGEGKGSINVLISRRNQSLSVEVVEERILESIAAMGIEDKIAQSLQDSLSALNLDEKVRMSLSTELRKFDLAGQIRAVILQHIASGSLVTGADIDSITERLDALSASSSLLFARLQTTVDALAGLQGSVRVLQSFLSGGVLSVHTVRTQMLTAEMATIGTLSAGSLTVEGATVLSGPTTIGQMSVSGSRVRIGSLTATGALEVVGSITIDGLARFLGNVSIAGQLVLSSKQAGFAVIPATGSSVTVLYEVPLLSTGAVHVTPHSRVGAEWWVESSTATGFTIAVSSILDHDVRFVWTALAVDLPRLTMGTGSLHGAAPIPFYVNLRGQPTSSDQVWNACIQGRQVILDGNVLSCSRYHNEYTWEHPDLLISFTYNPNHEPPILLIPDGYVITVIDDGSSGGIVTGGSGGDEGSSGDGSASSGGDTSGSSDDGSGSTGDGSGSPGDDSGSSGGDSAGSTDDGSGSAGDDSGSSGGDTDSSGDDAGSSSDSGSGSSGGDAGSSGDGDTGSSDGGGTGSSEGGAAE